MSGKSKKIKVKERFFNGEIDLSMSDLEEVPLKEIAAQRNVHSLDLSNNRLTSLSPDFSPTLSFLSKLDLSKNQLTSLPLNFGQLPKLKYLDLYMNQIERLPLSFAQLTSLKFLDLKGNPLVPSIAKVAGPCADTKDCQKCARDVITFYQLLEKQMKEDMSEEVTDVETDIVRNKRQEKKHGSIKDGGKVKKRKKVEEPIKVAETISGNEITDPTIKSLKKSVCNSCLVIAIALVTVVMCLMAVKWHKPFVSDYLRF